MFYLPWLIFYYHNVNNKNNNKNDENQTEAWKKLIEFGRTTFPNTYEQFNLKV